MSYCYRFLEFQFQFFHAKKKTSHLICTLKLLTKWKNNSNQEKSLEGISIRTKVVIVYLFNILIFAFCTDNNWTLDSSNTLNWIGFGSLIYSHILWWSHTNDHIYHNITVKITNKCGIRHIVFKMYFYRLVTFVLFPCVIFCFETNNCTSIVVTNDFIIQ